MPLIKVDQSKQPLVIFVALVVIVISGAFIVRSFYRPRPRANTTPFLAIAPAMAEETAKLLVSTGKIALVTYDLKQEGAVLLRDQSKLFRSTLAKHSGIVIAAESQVILPSDVLPEEAGLPADEYLRILRENPDLDAIVSFIGSPSLTDKQIRQLPRRIPKCVVVNDPGTGRLRKLLENDIVQVAIISRFEPLPPAAKKPITMKEWFDAHYQVVTRNMAPSLPQ